jgi:hypothetical protein
MVLTEEQETSFSILFTAIYKGDKHATALSFNILKVLHTWDDLIDKDKPVSEEAINSAFLTALIDIASNPLWTMDMGAHLLGVYLRWSDANKLEQPNASEDDLAKAWMLRAGLYDLFVILASKLHGRTWAEEIGPTVRRFYGEPLAEFILEVQNA